MMDKNPVIIEELSTKVDGLTKTVGNLVALVQAGFAAMDSKIDAGYSDVKTYVDTRVNHLEARMDRQFEALEERTFNPEEKESVVAAADAYSQQLEDSALGTKDITLTRSEYDATAISSSFPNRFTTPAEVLVD